MKKGMINRTTLGAMVGVAAGLMIASNMDRGTRKRIRKIGKRMRNTAEDFYFGMNGRMM